MCIRDSSKTGAAVQSDRVWLDGKLAYPIDGRRRGVHFLVYFQGEGSANTEIARQVRLSDLVLRHIVIRHPEVMWDRLVAAITASEEAEAPKATAKTTEATAKTTEATEKTTEATTSVPTESTETAMTTDETTNDAGEETTEDAGEETTEDLSLIHI